MAKFEFPDFTEVTLTNVNGRKENHGEQLVQAVDLAFSADFPNDILDQKLAPGLKATHFHNAAADAGQEELDPAVLSPNLPNLKYPLLNGQSFKWAGKDKVSGYKLEIDYGLGEEAGSNVFLDLCTVTNKAYELSEGGTTTLKWTVQCHGEQLTPEVLGILMSLGGEKVKQRLLAPVVAIVTPEKPKVQDTQTNPLPFDADSDQPQNPFEPGSPEAALTAAQQTEEQQQ